MATTNYPWGPLTYVSPYPVSGTNYPYSPYSTTQSAPNTIVWVQGELGARNYPIAPNTSVLLMDSESSKFYIKSADLLGVQTVRSYEYNELVPTSKPVEPETVEQTKPSVDSKSQNESQVEFVSRKEFDELKKTIDDLMS